MKNINLLPKIPRIQQIFLPTLAATAVFFAGTAGTMLYVQLRLTEKANGIEQSMALENANMARLMKQKTIDPQTKQYQELNKQVSQLKKQGRDWIPFFDILTNNLPEAARIVTAKMEASSSTQQAGAQASPTAQAATGATPTSNQTQDAGQVSLSMEFGKMEDAAYYVIRLQQSGVASKVSVKSISRVEKVTDLTQSNASSSSGTSTGSSSSGAAAPTLDVANSGKDIFSKALENQLPQAEDESQALLNQFIYTLQQKYVNEKLNLNLPDRTYQAPVSSDIDPKIAEEYAKTKAEFDDLNQTLNKSNVLFYKVELELSLANPNQNPNQEK
ncbi:hypothetical protein B5M42_001215 [Paenibacillus athensensis]|uniref:Fimbrial assembly protein n=1 Tax=Paenibacillus athensensis TaxID=1967502 RepID=A0A4Y8Q6W9_9BACL|nr:hypothetical protein [Paenibacillus athensensis]MCD1257456.1 hypothetical protein [Paenibacillus athensensis]